jgi:hypothetical protein
VILYSGPSTSFDFTGALDLSLGTGVMIVSPETTDSPTDASPVVGPIMKGGDHLSGSLDFTWDPFPGTHLAITVPAMPREYPLRTSIWRQR